MPDNISLLAAATAVLLKVFVSGHTYIHTQTAAGEQLSSEHGYKVRS